MCYIAVWTHLRGLALLHRNIHPLPLHFSVGASLVLPLYVWKVSSVCNVGVVHVWCGFCPRTLLVLTLVGAGLSPSCKSSCFVCRKRYAKRSLQLFWMQFLTLQWWFKHRDCRKKNVAASVQFRWSALCLLSLANRIVMVFIRQWKLN